MTKSQEVAVRPGAQPEPSGSPIISIRNVEMRFPIPKRYREMLLHPLRPRRTCNALNGVSVEIEKGDRIAVLGPNGAGKTTLLKLIGGLLLPTAGDIVVNGFDTWQYNTAARKSVGFVLNEERSFFWRLSAVENLEFFGALDNLWGPDLEQRIKELISLVGLEEAADKQISGFSSGMKQRLALARGLIAEPEVLILDEPTRALDPLACDEFQELIMRRIHKDSGKTLLIATHRLEEAERLCNKVLVINRGLVKAFDSLADINRNNVSLLQYYRQALEAGVS